MEREKRIAIAKKILALVDTDEPELLPDQILLYPNPARDQFRLQLPAPLEDRAQLSLFDGRGSLVQRGIMAIGEREHTVEVGQLPKGLYFVQLQIGAQTVTRRVVVQ